MRLARLLVAACGLLVFGAWAVEPASREELKRQREAIEVEHDRRAEACRHQFVVTPCLDKVRADRQQALSSVQDQERALDAAQRQLKAQQRENRLADKAQAAQKDRPLATPRATPRAEAPTKASAVAQPKKPRAAASSPQERQAREQQQRAEYEARQREIRTHREEVEKRNAARAARKAPQPLPAPASAAP